MNRGRKTRLVSPPQTSHVAGIKKARGEFRTRFLLMGGLSYYSMIVKIDPSERPNTSGKYSSRAVAGIT